MNFSLKGWCLVVVAASAFGAIPASAEAWNLPNRESPTPSTTDGVPHIQIGVEAVPELSAELLHRVSKIPGVEFRATVVLDATGFWLNESVKLARPDVIVRGREFAHKHRDGSLHASLSPKMAAMAVQAGWAIHHPYASQRPGWAGFVMIYTPKSTDELEVVFLLVMEAYKFLAGIDASSPGG